jgi:hypothetical protein
MIAVSCLCGGVRVEVAVRPEYLHECNCKLCRKTGARWGYFHPSDVRVEGQTQGFVRQDKASAGSEARFCGTCGSTTHFVLTEAAKALHGDVMLGVNLRLADESDLAGIELRFPDGAAWPGEGAFEYVGPPRVIGA